MEKTKPLNAYEELAKGTVSIVPNLLFHFAYIFKTMCRRLQTKATIHNPWSVNVQERMLYATFFAWFCAVRDHRTTFGRELEITKYKKSPVHKSYTVKFTFIGAVRYHMGKAIGDANIKELFC